MKIFLSYRRDDTGGRAGRLYDHLAARYGPQHVFQDVTAVAPGSDFVEQVESAVTASDVVLVVIGPRWLASVGPDGGRRVDRPDDYVRHEVTVAIAADVPLVPVLVDDAELPAAVDLPDELVPLVRRQAATIRDVSWHQDVDHLVRRLEGAQHPLTPDRRRPTWRATAAAMAVGVVVASAVVLLALRGDGGDDDSGGGIPACPESDSSWTQVNLADHAPIVVEAEDHLMQFEARGGRFREDADGGALIVVDVALTNMNDPVAGSSDDEFYYSDWVLRSLLVDGVVQDRIVCENILGDAQIQPGRTAIGTFGFESELDPDGATIDFATVGDGLLPIGSS